MIEHILIGFIVFLCALIGTACALAPFFAHLNNKINKNKEIIISKNNLLKNENFELIIITCL